MYVCMYYKRHGMILPVCKCNAGLLDADVECLDLLSTLPGHVEYAIVFTKVDKFRGDGSGTDKQHV